MSHYDFLFIVGLIIGFPIGKIIYFIIVEIKSKGKHNGSIDHRTN